MNQRETLGNMEGCVKKVLHLAAERYEVKGKEEIKQDDDMVWQPANKKHNDVGENNSPIALPFLVIIGRYGPGQKAIENSDDRKGNDKTENNRAQFHASQPLLGIFLWIDRPTVGFIVGRNSLQVIGIRKRHKEGKKPDEDADTTADYLLFNTAGGCKIDNGEIPIHTHAGKEEDAPVQIDGKDKMSDFAGDLSHMPLVVLNKGDHPDWQSDDHKEVGNGQIEDVEMSFVAGSFGLKVHPDHHKIGHKSYHKYKDIKNGENIEEGTFVDSIWTG